ncbi:hypothetical protein PHYSODRAFT_390035, partial [Phytophthora sojae]
PTHPIWQHSIFQSREFTEFKSEVMQAVDAMEDPTEQRLQKAVPVLNAKIDGLHQDFKSSLAQVCSTMRTVQGSLSDVMRVDRTKYKLRRGLATVPDLWKEWSVGLDGARAVRDLEDQFGTKWCSADERRFFNRGRPIYSLVAAVA